MADNWSNAIVGNYDPAVLQDYKNRTTEDPRFGIVGALAKHFGDKYSIYSREDVSQDLQEPAFFVYQLIMNVQRVFGLHERLDYYYDIHYIPKTDERKTQLYSNLRDTELEIYEALRQIQILGYDPAKDEFNTFILSGDEMRATTTGGVLHYFVHYKAFYMRPEIEIPAMETLEQNALMKE